MGSCSSSTSQQDRLAHETRVNLHVSQALANAKKEEERAYKVLMLGAGGSGKSTLFKQMRWLYGEGFPAANRREFAPIIHDNIIGAIVTLIDKHANFGDQPLADSTLAPARLILTANVQSQDQPLTIDPQLAEAIRRVWEDPGIQSCFQRRREFVFDDSASHFMKRLDVVGQPDYTPTLEDVLYCRTRTSGIVEEKFVIKSEKGSSQFHVYDVGGQRNERKKWIHCFENVTAILFIASLSAYDQVLDEDGVTNAMEEALNLFEDISNSHWFQNTSIVLFLNKTDLFAEKVGVVPLKNYFPAYQFPETFEDCEEWIEDQFVKRNESDKKIYVHLTCATSTENVNKVFLGVRDTVVNQILDNMGFRA